jgi:hypothetical protein
VNLSDHIIAINNAFEALMSSIADLEPTPQHRQDSHGIQVRHDLPRIRDAQIPTTYHPMTNKPTIHNEEKLLQLAAFEATY